MDDSIKVDHAAIEAQLDDLRGKTAALDTHITSIKQGRGKLLEVFSGDSSHSYAGVMSKLESQLDTLHDNLESLNAAALNVSIMFKQVDAKNAAILASRG